MPFARHMVSALLAECHRRCCICHRFCGVKMETDHILPRDDGGDDSIENAIPVCFECHAEIHSYNDRHPRGRKFLPEELKVHKEQWLQICKERPEILITASHEADVGPLQALIDELTFNEKVSLNTGPEKQGCRFHDQQFRRAINDGSIAILLDEIKDAIIEAYIAMDAANVINKAAWNYTKGSNPWGMTINEANKRITQASRMITNARNQLLKFLSSAEEDA